MKEPIQVDRRIDVHELMDKYQITQEKANKLAQTIDSDPSAKKQFSWVPKFVVTPA
jgi:hypothetical protein